MGIQDMYDWGRDPSVKSMRKVFKEMEKTRAELLDLLQILPYDPRIRAWSEKSLLLFENTLRNTGQRGLAMDKKMAAALYINCLAGIIRTEGIEIPESFLPYETISQRLIDEART